MKLPLRMSCVALALFATTARAQSQGDVAAWFAMVLTPVGAFAPMQIEIPGTGAQRHPAWALRATTWKFSGPGEDRNNDYGVSYVAPVGDKTTLTATGGWFKPGGGDATAQLGADLQSPFWQSVGTASRPMTVSASIRGSLGFGRFTGSGGGTALSFVGSAPLAVRYPTANKSVLSANFTPGFGWGQMSGGGGSSQSGTRPLISFGGAWTSPSGVGLHLGVQKVLLQGDPPWLWGFAFSFVPGM